MPHVLILVGSARRDSLNAKLAQAAATLVAEAGATVGVFDAAAAAIPLYDGDLEAAQGLPPGVVALKQQCLAADGLLVASPEYNGSITPLLKNLLDWASRPATDDEPPLACYRGKVAALVAASPGALGGLRGLVHLRAILGHVGVHVTPTQYALAQAAEKFSPTGELIDAQARQRLQTVVDELVTTTSRLAG